jgi:chemotaxis-related protein WspB
MLMLVFRVGEDLYAIGATEVVEVVPSVRLRHIPQAPEYVDGIFNYRGALAPVVDLCRLMYSRPSHDYLSTRIILVRCRALDGRDQVIGLRAEQVTDTMQVEETAAEGRPVSVTAAPYLGPVFSTPAGLIQRIRPEPLVSGSLTDSIFARISEQS